MNYAELLCHCGGKPQAVSVPATGAGVDCQFSKSGRVASWSRSCLNPESICDEMRLKDYLSRIGQPLVTSKKRQRGNKVRIEEVAVDDLEDLEEDGDKIKMLEWEKEWWQKVGARLVF